MKFLFLEIKQLKAENEYQQQIIVLQTMHFYRKVMLEALIPAIIFSSLVFFPLGWGLGLLGLVVGLAIASNILIDKIFTPEKEEDVSEFPQDEFDAFCENPNILDKPAHKSKSSFFNHEQKHHAIDNSVEEMNVFDKTHPDLS